MPPDSGAEQGSHMAASTLEESSRGSFGQRRAPADSTQRAVPRRRSPAPNVNRSSIAGTAGRIVTWFSINWRRIVVALKLAARDLNLSCHSAMEP